MGSEQAPVNILLDCDPGIDDAMAIFYGLLAPEISLAAIGTVWGNCSVELATINTIRLLEIAGIHGIPVAQGASRPLLGPPPDFDGLIHGLDGQGNQHLPDPAGTATGETAADQIVRLGRERSGELTLVAVGPLTNLALALAIDPATAGRYREVVVMGGCFLVPGNVGPYAEANIWHDPEAAQIVLDAGWPVTLVGLDVTEPTRITEAMLADLAADGSSTGVHLHRINDVYLTAYAERYGYRECPMHDALALAIAADPSLVLDARTTRVDVELTGTHTRGMTVADLRVWAQYENANGRVVLKTAGQRFVNRWLEVLKRPAVARNA